MSDIFLIRVTDDIIVVAAKAPSCVGKEVCICVFWRSHVNIREYFNNVSSIGWGVPECYSEYASILRMFSHSDDWRGWWIGIKSSDHQYMIKKLVRRYALCLQNR